MPYSSEKIIIAGTKFDKRIKLLPSEYESVRKLYAELKSQRKVADHFGVSRRLITFILDPEKHRLNLERREERGGGQIYYTKEKQREYIKNHRRYKHALSIGGLI